MSQYKNEICHPDIQIVDQNGDLNLPSISRSKNHYRTPDIGEDDLILDLRKTKNGSTHFVSFDDPYNKVLCDTGFITQNLVLNESTMSRN